MKISRQIICKISQKQQNTQFTINREKKNQNTKKKNQQKKTFCK